MSDKRDSSKKNMDKTIAKVKQKPESQCPICLENISNRSRTDPCHHEFCLQCLRHWSNDHNFCPVCRQVFDRILYNIRGDSYDSIAVTNRQSRVRGSLFTQRNTLRESLARLRSRVDQQLETLRRRLRNREEARNRINESLRRIDAIDRQNNDEIDQTLNQIRNTINEINHQDFVEGVSDPRMDLSKFNPIFEPTLLPITRWFDNHSDSMTVNQSASSGNHSDSPTIRSDLTGSDIDSDQTGPRVIEWQIDSPNSVGTVRVSSNDSPNGSVRSISSVIFSHSSSENEDSLDVENMALQPFFRGHPFSRANQSKNNDFDVFEQFDNDFNQMFEDMATNRSHLYGQRSGSRFSMNPSLNYGSQSTSNRNPRIRAQPFNTTRNTNSNRLVNVSSSSNDRHSANNPILRRNMEFVNRINRNTRSSNQRLQNYDRSPHSHQSDSDSE